MKILKVNTKNRKIADIGEEFASKYLKKNGYKIIERNYAPIDCEIDIIAENKTDIAFVEVKTRTIGKENDLEPRPASSVTPEKQRKIIKAARYFLGYQPKEKHISLDVIEVYLTPENKAEKICHFQNAFNINSANRR